MSPDAPPQHRVALPPVRRAHLDELRAFGPIAQHATLAVPDAAHGSCTDDVARGLEVDLMHGGVIGWERVEASAWSGLTYLGEAIDAGSGRFVNFRDVDGRWLEAVGSEDAQGRAILALGRAVASAPERSFRDAAMQVLLRALPCAGELRAMHARASALIGCAYASEAGPTRDAGPSHAVGARLADSLAADFAPVAASDTWPWPEVSVTYESALMPRALIIGGRLANDPRLIETGLAVLGWITGAAVSDGGHLSPVGNHGWWVRAGSRARFDQQPIEAASFVLAAEAALDATGDGRHLDDAERAFAWFTGHNDGGIVVADPGRGGCRDGLGADGCNENQGAESTLAWLVSVERIRVMRRALPGREPDSFAGRQPGWPAIRSSGSSR